MPLQSPTRLYLQGFLLGRRFSSAVAVLHFVFTTIFERKHLSWWHLVNKLLHCSISPQLEALHVCSVVGISLFVTGDLSSGYETAPLHSPINTEAYFVWEGLEGHATRRSLFGGLEAADDVLECCRHDKILLLQTKFFSFKELCDKKERAQRGYTTLIPLCSLSLKM